MSGTLPLGWRVREALSSYVPVLLMALLAAATWWLVKNTPLQGEAAPDVPPRHEPDYTMQDFLVQRYAKDGALRVQLEGDVLRHYPDTDTLEIDNVRVRAIGLEGRVTVATARRAVSNSDASEVQLVGDAHVVREAWGQEPQIDMRGEFLHAFLDTERVRSHLPVVVRQNGTEVRADTFEYDNLERIVKFSGHVRATILPRPAPAASRPAE
jgi:lipopolysaccharide export system protein LptC